MWCKNHSLTSTINWKPIAGGIIAQLYNNNIEETAVPKPPIAEQALVNANKELIRIYEQKIKDKIDEVWCVGETIAES